MHFPEHLSWTFMFAKQLELFPLEKCGVIESSNIINKYTVAVFYFIYFYFIKAFTNLQLWSRNQSNSSRTKKKDYKYSNWFCLIIYK